MFKWPFSIENCETSRIFGDSSKGDISPVSTKEEMLVHFSSLHLRQDSFLGYQNQDMAEPVQGVHISNTKTKEISTQNME